MSITHKTLSHIKSNKQTEERKKISEQCFCVDCLLLLLLPLQRIKRLKRKQKTKIHKQTHTLDENKNKNQIAYGKREWIECACFQVNRMSAARVRVRSDYALSLFQWRHNILIFFFTLCIHIRTNERVSVCVSNWKSKKLILALFLHMLHSTCVCVCV